MSSRGGIVGARRIAPKATPSSHALSILRMAFGMSPPRSCSGGIRNEVTSKRTPRGSSAHRRRAPPPIERRLYDRGADGRPYGGAHRHWWHLRLHAEFHALFYAADLHHGDAAGGPRGL